MATTLQPAPRAHEATTAVPRWRAIVWDDPVNLMSYVSAVFREYFGYSAARANELMMRVHTRGRATVSTGVRERIEADVMAMHSYGLRATIEEDGD
ncbi:Clp protease ClpS [Schaalia meyeri]|uniref:ATP-dependent Clp protease adapter ClpS n=1 Tax=Schaalia meyeri TaxID=52773 RepID=UPI000680D6C4|nr:ATP-dependent Clp protease adapter ClpS [Schaalia meyeri]AKU64630.1 Clp protease ClpS [Schaalia meyeri]